MLGTPWLWSPQTWSSKRRADKPLSLPVPAHLKSALWWSKLQLQRAQSHRPEEPTGSTLVSSPVSLSFTGREHLSGLSRLLQLHGDLPSFVRPWGPQPGLLWAELQVVDTVSAQLCPASNPKAPHGPRPATQGRWRAGRPLPWSSGARH